MKTVMAAAFAALILAGTGLRAQVKSDTWTFPAKEDLPRIAELPDPFFRQDGSRVQTPEEWAGQREYLKAMLAHYMYGTMPPAPASVTGEILYTRSIHEGRAIAETVKITFSPGDRDGDGISFIAEVTRPDVEGKVPVIVWNQFTPSSYDGCPEEEELVCNRHYAIVEYKKEQLAEDSVHAMDGPLAKAYPDYSWGAIAMWAWTASRVVDYLQTTDYADMDRLVSTGHSRGGKVALCAAVYDERFALCAANGSGCGGAGCFRFMGSRLGEGYGSVETLGRVYDYFPFWWAEGFGQFGSRRNDLDHTTMMTADMEAVRSEIRRPYASDGVDNEEFLPFDLHFVRALIAPRALLTTEGLADTWANIYGSQLTWIASDEVYQFLGAKGLNAMHIREGRHVFSGEDWLVIADFCDKVFFGKEPVKEFLTNPAAGDPADMKGKNPVLHYSWTRPSSE